MATSSRGRRSGSGWWGAMVVTAVALALALAGCSSTAARSAPDNVPGDPIIVPPVSATEPPPSSAVTTATVTSTTRATVTVDPALATGQEQERRNAVARAFPVLPAASSSYAHEHHDYPASDIFGRCGDTVVAPVTGVVVELSRADQWDPAVNDPATRGGLFIGIVGDDGVRYYMAHLARIDDGVEVGARVLAGDQIAVVGDTGNASVCHVHFGMSTPCDTGEWWVRRGNVWPWPYLDQWKQGVNASPVAEIDSWAGSHAGVCNDPALLEWSTR